MHKESTHLFTNTDTGCSVTFHVREVIAGDYGLYVWPSAVVLSEYMWQNKENFKDKSVLELGAGTALPSLITAAFCANNVYITDARGAKEVLDN